VGSVVSFRDVDERVFREFKAVAAREGLRMGDALNSALALFTAQARGRQAKRAGLLSLEPVGFGPQNRRLSKQADEVLYGWKR